MFHNVLNCVNEEKVINTLHNTGKSFKAHTCINVRMFKRSVVTFAVTLKLSKYKVPNLNKTVTFTAYMTVGSAAALFVATVKVDFGARTAGA